MKALKKLLKAGKNVGEQENAFVAEHRVSNKFRFSKTFEVEDFNGLLFCQLVTVENGARKVISYWTNRDSYQSDAAPFKAALGDAEVMDGGWHSEIKTKNVPLWRRVSILSAILFITTVLGFWKTMSDQFDEWFEPPALEVFSGQQGPFQIVVNQDAEVSVLFRNQSISTRAIVGDIHCFLVDGTRSRPVFQNLQIVALEKGEKMTQNVPLNVPKAGGYILRTEATIKAGKFRMKRTQTNDFQIQVWPEFAFERAKVLQLNSNKCRIAVELISGTGSTNQLKCEALLTDDQDSGFETAGPAQGIPEVYRDPISKSAEIDWLAQPPGPFLTRKFVLYMNSELPKTAAEWTNLIDRIHFQASKYSPQNQ